jgi:glutamine---fructose-6-phosphate transaminase (isomerizing)
MNPLLSEIDEIPERAADFLKYSPEYKLPRNVPYLGMGSSYFAPMALKYMGIDIRPELSSEYFQLNRDLPKAADGVILSQSGESSESVWCTGLFNSFTAITNDQSSSLGRHPAAAYTVGLRAGEEKYSSTKTYVNTLMALIKGLGMNPEPAISVLRKNANGYKDLGRTMAEKVFNWISSEKIHGIYVTGSGPNIGTAYEAALILSESTKICHTGLPLAQYDHGPKETAAGSIVIQILSKGRAYDRTMRLSETISEAGAHVLTVGEHELPEYLSVLCNIVPFNYMAAFLAELLNIGETFAIGGKVTTVPE